MFLQTSFDSFFGFFGLEIMSQHIMFAYIHQ